MKDTMKWIGSVLFYVMAVALVVYAASRTLDFVNSTLGADDQIIGYLALFATTGGAIAWLAVFLYKSKGVAQKGISLVMVVIDVLGEISLFTIDTLMRSADNGLIVTLSPEEVRLTVMGMSLLIGLNIIATFAYHIMDSDNIAAMEEHISDWQIELAIQKAKREKAESIASEIAQREAEAYAVAQKTKDRTDKTQDERTIADLLGLRRRKNEPVALAAEAKETKPETADNFRRQDDKFSAGMQDPNTGEFTGV